MITYHMINYERYEDGESKTLPMVMTMEEAGFWLELLQEITTDRKWTITDVRIGELVMEDIFDGQETPDDTEKQDQECFTEGIPEF